MIICGVIVEPNKLDNLKLVKPYHVARALGRIARFAGNTEEPCSVLNHSLAGAFYALAKWNDGGEAALAFLVHDAVEAVTGDITRPFKTEEQKLMESDVHVALMNAWGLSFKLDTIEAVGWLDKAICNDEAHEYGLPGFPHGDSGDMMLRRIVRDVKVKFPFADHPDLWALFHEVVTTKNPNLLDLAFKT